MKVSAIIFLTLASLCCLAQSEKPVEVVFDSDIVATYIDRPGDIYVALKNKVIEKYDINGNKLASSSMANPTIFEPWYGINILISNINENKYTITDRNIQNPRSFTIDAAFAIEPSLICLSGEKNIWVLDKADMSLKKINTLESRVIAESIIPDSVKKDRNFIFMREYQNFLFLQDRNGRISIFSPLGIYMRDILLPGMKSFNFLGEELYYYTMGQLIFFDLFDTRSRSKSVDRNVRSVLLTDTKTIEVFSSKIVIRPNNP